MEPPGPLLSPSLKKLKKTHPKKFLIFQEMKISSTKIKKLLYFWKWNFLASFFSYILGRNLPSLQNKKKPP